MERIYSMSVAVILYQPTNIIYPHCTKHQAGCSRSSTAHQSMANCTDWLTLRGSQGAWVPDAIYGAAHNRLIAHWLQTGSKSRMLPLMRAACEKEVERGGPREERRQREGETETTPTKKGGRSKRWRISRRSERDGGEKKMKRRKSQRRKGQIHCEKAIMEE